MITSLRIKNFKSLRDVDLSLGPLNVFIGANASGKSNVFDALRVLQGIGNSFAVGEILDGKPRSSTTEVWEPIRGGSTKAAFIGQPPSSVVGFELSVSAPPGSHTSDVPLNADYGISFDVLTHRLTQEWLKFANDDVFDSRPIQQPGASPIFQIKYYQGKRGKQPHLECEPTRPVLAQLARGDFKKVLGSDVNDGERLCRVLANMQRLDPHPAQLRAYSQAQKINRMGERGENFAALIRTICEDENQKSAYLTWLRHLRPSEVDDVDVVYGAVGEPLFALKEAGREFPAPVLSDGTLRFAAITAAFFQPDMPGLLTIEEIENGIHASRLRLLIELLRNRTGAGQTQAIVTTHSPVVLSWLTEEEYSHTYFCKRDEHTGESRILPLTKIPDFLDIVKRQSIGDLFAEGWLENAL